MKGAIFGLDIGATSLKGVWMSSEKEGQKLLAALIVPAPPKGMLSESPLDHEAMARSIRDLVARSQIPTKYVNIALPENQVFTRVLEMPLLSDKELSSAIYWEAEQYIPMPLPSVTLDWKVLSRPKDENGKMHVLLVGAPTNLIQKYQKIFDLSGLIINAVETEIVSVVRTLIRSEKSPNSLIVHIGAVNTSLTIIKEGIIVFAYSIATGGVAITRVIASDFSFSIQQAEEYKKTYGISQSNPVGGKIGKATEPVLLTIVSEAKKAIAFYNEKYKNESPISQILLCGGTAKLSGIDLFFAKNCGIETVVANPWHIFGLSLVLPKEIVENGPEYAIAVGLALRGYE